MNELQEYWETLLCRAGISDNNSRHPDIVSLRYIYYFWGVSQKKHTLREIGQVVGRDHSSVLHGLKMYKKYLETKDKYFLSLIDRIEREDKTYQIIVCPACRGYVLYEETPVKNGFIYGQLIGRGYIVKYSTNKPLVKCNCEN